MSGEVRFWKVKEKNLISKAMVKVISSDGSAESTCGKRRSRTQKEPGVIVSAQLPPDTLLRIELSLGWGQLLTQWKTNIWLTKKNKTFWMLLLYASYSKKTLQMPLSQEHAGLCPMENTVLCLFNNQPPPEPRCVHWRWQGL